MMGQMEANAIIRNLNFSLRGGSTIDSEGFKAGTRGAPIMPRDAVSRTANVERTGRHKWVNNVRRVGEELCRLYGEISKKQYLIYICLRRFQEKKIAHFFSLLENVLVFLVYHFFCISGRILAWE